MTDFKGLNLKEVCKQIKSCGKHRLIWSRSNGHHYITNRHWMVRFPVENLPREVLVTLFAIFAEIPKEDRALSTFGGVQSDIEAVSVQSIYASLRETVEGKATPFIKDLDRTKMRVISCNGEFIFINEEYSKMVDMQEHNPMCKGRLNPLFFMDGALVILPYRLEDLKDRQILTELIES